MLVNHALDFNQNHGNSSYIVYKTRDSFFFLPFIYFHKSINRFDKYLTNYYYINEQIQFNERNNI